MANLIWGASRRILDDNGDPVSGGKVYVYAEGTTTAVTTYSDDGLATANAHPVVADASGVVGPIFVPYGTYKVRVTDASDVVLYEDDSVETTRTERPYVLLGTGQSNMDGADTGGDLTTNANVLAWDHGASAWVTADPQLAPFPVNANNNMLFHAGKEIQARTGAKVYLILVSLSGAAIERWESGDATPTMWTEITDTVPTALAAIGQTTVDVVLWHQGEANATDREFVYRDKLIGVKDQMVAEDWWDDGKTFMLCGELADHDDNTSRGKTFAIKQAALIDEDIAVVSSQGVTTDSAARVHFDGAGLVEMGQRMGAAALQSYPPRSADVDAFFAPDDIFFTIDPVAANGDFTNLYDALFYFSKIKVGKGCRPQVTVAAGQYTMDAAGLRIRLDHGESWEFTGELDAGWTQPVQGDFSGTKATDLATMQADYLTELKFPSHGLIVAGNHAGLWKDMLISVDTPGLSQSAVRTDETTIPHSEIGGSISLENCVLFGYDGTTCRAVFADLAGRVHMELCTIAYSTIHLVAQQNSSIWFKNGVVYSASGEDGNCTGRSYLYAYAASTNKVAGTAWVSATGAYIDVRTATYTGNSTATNGIVQV